MSQRSRSHLAAALALALWLSAGCRASHAPGGFLPEPVVPVTPYARVTQIEGPAPLWGGLVEGTAGDWILENDRLTVVVRGVENRSVLPQEAGRVVDAAPRGGRDALRSLATIRPGPSRPEFVYHYLFRGQETDSLAVSLVARGRDADLPHLNLETRYVLRPGEESLSVLTRFVNTGRDTVRGFRWGDAIDWGWAEPMVPRSSGAGGPGDNVPWVAAGGDGAGYAWVPTEGGFTARREDYWTVTTGGPVDLSPGDTLFFRRRLVVVRGSEAEALGAASLVWGSETPGWLVVEVLDSEGEPVAQARVEARDEEAALFARGRTLGDGWVRLPVPQGTYRVHVSHPHHGRAWGGEISVPSGLDAETRVTLPAAARVKLRARDDRGEKTPARWIFTGIDETSDPDLGPSFRGPSSGRSVLTAGGELEIRFPPGSYRVLTTRGPGVEGWESELRISPGEKKTLEARLEPLPIPDEWIPVDCNTHALPGARSRVTRPDRARSLVCEGIRWFAATDSASRNDFGATLDTLVLSAPLGCLTGEEVTLPGGGLFSLFPVEARDGLPGHGALDPRWLTLEDTPARLRALAPNALVQLLHPRANGAGYLDRLDDRARNRLRSTWPDTSLRGLGPLWALEATLDSATYAGGTDFDLIEINPSGDRDLFERLWIDWMTLLERGNRVTGVGSSGIRELVSQGVHVRSYVRVDDPMNATAEDVVRGLRLGRVVVSGGPFIDFTLEGKGVGSSVIHDGGVITGHVRILAPRWVEVSRVTVVVNGLEEAVFEVRGRDRAVRFDEDVELLLKNPGFVLVRAEGRSSPGGDTSGDDALLPLAFTNPIWVEIPSASR